MPKSPFALVAVFALVSLAGCAGAGGGFGGGDSSKVVGDENGGKIANTLGTSQDQTSAYQTVTSYCEKFSKKGVITKMDYDTGLVTFDCRVIKKTGK